MAEESESEELTELDEQNYDDDFDMREKEHDLTFQTFGKRLSCFAHTLQLVVNKFSEDRSFASVLKRVSTLVKKVNKSSKATEMLISECRRKLVSSCPTRWSSTYLMVQRLLEVKVPLSKVLESLEWDNLATSEWKTLESVLQLLKPFAQYTSLVGGEDYVTISSVIPIVMELNLHLDEMKKTPEMSSVSHLLQSELKRRFRIYTDPSDPDSEPLFLMSTMLDPRYKVLLNRNQSDSTKAQLLKQLTESAENSGDSNSPTSATPTPSPDEGEPPATKRFHHLSRLLQEKSKEGSKKVDKSPPVKLELEHYLNIQPQFDEEADVMQFWIDAKEYPVLSSVALDILTIPESC